ncbi:hypothetical protein HY256_03865 [Candidatus Sumerlaeota bacterium]|nr:hypothetical protein [Candidatus Sumerlaeota bacterium]
MRGPFAHFLRKQQQRRDANASGNQEHLLCAAPLEMQAQRREHVHHRPRTHLGQHSRPRTDNFNQSGKGSGLAVGSADAERAAEQRVVAGSVKDIDEFPRAGRLRDLGIFIGVQIGAGDQPLVLD